MWEIRYVDRKSREVIVIRCVSSFALARTIAVELPQAAGKQIVIRKCTTSKDPLYNVWLWVIESQEWIRLQGDPLTKRGSLRFHARFKSYDAVPVYWPVGVKLPEVPAKSTIGTQGEV